MGRKSKQLGIDEVFDISMGMFEYSVRVVLTPDLEKCKKYVAYVYDDKDEPADAEEELARGRLFRKQNYIPILWLPKYPETPREYATVAHECVHAVLTMFEWAHVPQSWQTEEVEAHAVGWLVDRILSHKPKGGQ